MASDGEDERGYAPFWYRVIKAGEILQCKPWEVLAQDMFWMNAALAARHAEAKAEKAKRIKSEHRSKIARSAAGRRSRTRGRRR